MDQILNYSTDILYHVLDYLDFIDLFNLASNSKEVRNIVEKYYHSRKYLIMQISIRVSDYHAYFRIYISIDKTRNFQLDLSKNKKRRSKAKNYFRFEIFPVREKSAILPTFKPLIDELIRYSISNPYYTRFKLF